MDQRAAGVGIRPRAPTSGRAFLRTIPHEPPVWSAESAVMVGEDRREVLTAVARLPRRAREVLALRSSST